MKRKILLAYFVLLGVATLFTPLSVSAQFNDALNQACAGQGADSVACKEIDRGLNDTNPVTSTTQDVVDLMSLVIGIIAVIIIIVAGVTMTMSQGDSGKIKSSRDAILYSAVGLVVVALSRTIIIFILNRTS